MSDHAVPRRFPDDLILVAITSQHVAQTMPNELKIESCDPDFAMTGLKVTSIVRGEFVMTVPSSMVQKVIGELSGNLLHRVEDCLSRSMGLMPKITQRDASPAAGAFDWGAKHVTRGDMTNDRDYRCLWFRHGDRLWQLVSLLRRVEERNAEAAEAAEAEEGNGDVLLHRRGGEAAPKGGCSPSRKPDTKSGVIRSTMRR